jgi:hypothetical protein
VILAELLRIGTLEEVRCEMKYVLRVIPETCIWLILILALGITGCISSTTTSQPSSELRITPLNNKNTITLSADDIVRMMRQVGFSDEQIIELGGRMHDSLSHSGAAQLEIGNKIEAIFAVNDNFVYIATRLRGSFIYDVKRGRIVSSSQS